VTVAVPGLWSRLPSSVEHAIFESVSEMIFRRDDCVNARYTVTSDSVLSSGDKQDNPDGFWPALQKRQRTK
jgi:hypothetical protein